jgi:hypothetical protein
MSFTQGIALGQLGCFVETTANVLNNAPTGREWFAIQIIKVPYFDKSFSPSICKFKQRFFGKHYFW